MDLFKALTVRPCSSSTERRKTTITTCHGSMSTWNREEEEKEQEQEEGLEAREEEEERPRGTGCKRLLVRQGGGRQEGRESLVGGLTP